MDICVVSLQTGRVERICNDADDMDTLRRIVARQLRQAAALADECMRGGWEFPVPPVHVEPLQQEQPERHCPRGQ